MANRRMIARNVAKSKKLAKVSFKAESLWHRGHPFLDDFGCMSADPEEFRATVIPMGKNGKQIPLTIIEGVINELAEVGLIEICECEERRCMHYPKFEEFNTVKTDREPKSDCLDSNGFQRIPTVSLNLTKPNLTKPNIGDSDFEELWKTYPRKIGKQKASKCYQTRLKEGASHSLLLKASTNYARYVKSEKVEEKYIKHPATFLGPDKPYEDFINIVIEVVENCGTCKHGPAGATAYCIVANKSVERKDAKCRKYETGGDL